MKRDLVTKQKFTNAARLYIVELVESKNTENAKIISEFVNLMSTEELAKLCRDKGLSYSIKEGKVKDARKAAKDQMIRQFLSRGLTGQVMAYIGGGASGVIMAKGVGVKTPGWVKTPTGKKGIILGFAGFAGTVFASVFARFSDNCIKAEKEARKAQYAKFKELGASFKQKLSYEKAQYKRIAACRIKAYQKVMVQAQKAKSECKKLPDPKLCVKELDKIIAKFKKRALKMKTKPPKYTY